MKFFEMVGAITYEAWCTVRYNIVSNVYNVGAFVSMALPYVMCAVGQQIALERGYVALGGELLIPVVFGAIAYYMKAIGNKSGKGKSMPIPAKRFTTVDEDGEVTIERARLNELILYQADLEDWFAKRGML